MLTQSGLPVVGSTWIHGAMSVHVVEVAQCVRPIVRVVTDDDVKGTISLDNFSRHFHPAGSSLSERLSVALHTIAAALIPALS